MLLTSWLFWAIILFFQNWSFTFVSRARSSGSISRHAKASVFSNGIWIASQMIMLGPMFDYLTGKHGHGIQLAAASVYTVSCLGGSLFAHYWALKTEKGKTAVGASKLYAQVPVAEYARLKEIISDYDAAKAAQAQRDEDDVTAPSAPFGESMSSGCYKIVFIPWIEVDGGEGEGPAQDIPGMGLFTSVEFASQYLARIARLESGRYEVRLA